MSTRRPRLALAATAATLPALLAGCVAASASSTGALPWPRPAVASAASDKHVGSTCDDVLGRFRHPAEEAMAAVATLAAHPHLPASTRSPRATLAKADRAVADLREAADSASGPHIAALVDRYADDVAAAALRFRTGSAVDSTAVASTGADLVGVCDPFIERIRG